MDHLYMFCIIASITHIVGLYWMDYLLEGLDYGMDIKVKHIVFILMCPILCVIVLLGFAVSVMCSKVKCVAMKSKLVNHIRLFLNKRIM